MSRLLCIAGLVLFLLAGCFALLVAAFLHSPRGVTYANYSRIEDGMSVDEAVALLGEPTFTWRGDTQSQLTWRSATGDEVEARFNHQTGDIYRTWNHLEEDRDGLQRIRDRYPWIARKGPPPIPWEQPRIID